jgi:hypothetical protein
MAWSHVQLLYHATKNNRVGTASLHSSKGYPSFKVPTTIIYVNLDYYTKIIYVLYYISDISILLI